MFRKKIILSILTGLLFLSSCDEDVLDQEPVVSTIITDSIITVGDLRGYLNASYSVLASSDVLGTTFPIFGDMNSDNTFVSSTNSGYYLNFDRMNWGTNSAPLAMGSLYQAMIYCDFIINNSLELSEEEQEEANPIIGEAYIVRGYVLSLLVSLYGSNPTSGDFQEYGVPMFFDYTVETFDDIYRDVAQPRSTVAEVYAQAISDLSTGISLMPDAPTTTKTFLTPTAAKLLLSRIYLTLGGQENYQLSLNYADEVINNSPSTFEFMGSTDVSSYWAASPNLADNKPETIWEIEYTASSNPGVNALSNFYLPTGGYGSILFRQDFYESFGEGDEDKRKALFYTNDVPETDNPTGVWLRKYRSTQANTKVLRMSEAKLNKIEALYKLGQTGEALIELNAFAETRGLPANYYDGSDLLTQILDERRKEFCGEGYRFFDLKRNNLGFTKTSNCNSNECTIQANSRWMVLPMPRTELELNPNNVQHPLWQ